jgi:uncharacterized DUF497 family protein
MGKGKGKAGDKLKRSEYEEELDKLHVELVKLQEWVKLKGVKVCILFEGRDGAGKGGTIKAITERVSPRVFRVVALRAPTEREKSIQSWMAHAIPGDQEETRGAQRSVSLTEDGPVAPSLPRPRRQSATPGEAGVDALGLLREIVLSIVHTEEKDYIHIVSMRKATKREREIYFKSIAN